ncbi:MAG: HD domain-containing protein [Candidatus Omnitrophica bacterium]|nr:HD domain-containing protein [Candidatus Omnitrophota bacterium]MDE2223539.1 HD domain-containing protein [Candidatus Omnitrophota bacterium]
MGKKNKKVLFLASFEDASILRKFTILFLITSIIPMSLLYYFYYQNNHFGHIALTPQNYTYAMLLMGLGVFMGFIAIRSLLVKVIDISRQNSKALENLLSPETVRELNQQENEIVVLSRSFSAVTQRLEENVRSLEVAKKTLHAVMFKVSHGISNMGNIDAFLELILETLTNALNGKSGTLLLLNEAGTELSLAAVYGADYDPQKKLQLKLAGSPLSRVVTEKRPSSVSGIFLQTQDNPLLKELFTENLLCAPLIYHERVSGLMIISRPDGDQRNFSEEDLNLVFNLASQTAVAIENSKLNHDIEKTYFETISALALAVDAKDQYSRGHLDRVMNHAVMIGKALGLDDEDLETLRDAARLHDVGKIGIPDEILKKESSLSDEEWVIMRRHPEIGESIIKPVRSLQHLCDLIRHHHEKLDGSGYPDRLKGEEISPLVRILTVADMYDALTTERPYRSKKSPQEAIKILRSMKDQIDQDIVNTLWDSLETQEEVI